MKTESRIALGWIIPGESLDKFEIVGRDWEIGEGELVEGRYLNPPMGHDALWPLLQVDLGLDVYPYEYYPRFRIVFDTIDNIFTVWGDEKILKKPLWQLMVLKKYSLPHDHTKFRTDGLHYFSANPDSELVWDAIEGEMKLIIKSYDEMLEKIKEEKEDGFKRTLLDGWR